MLPSLELSGPVLLMEDRLPDLADAMRSEGKEVRTWSRRVIGSLGGEVWPPAGPYQAVALRLPRAKDELDMDLHAGASVLHPGGFLLVYGANDEGIKAALEPLSYLCPGAETVAVGGRCRVLKGIWRSGPTAVKKTLSEWKTLVDLNHPKLPGNWVSYPGVFAHGRLDEGTRLLLDSLPPVPPGARILDFGCGSGVIGYVAQEVGEGVEVEMVDVDAIALEAAAENVPGARLHLFEGLPAVVSGQFHAIFSNPPFHTGKTEDPELILRFIRGAPGLLRPSGILALVVQRRFPLESVLRDHFRDVEVLAEDGRFRVWQGKGPVRERKTSKGRASKGRSHVP